MHTTDTKFNRNMLNTLIIGIFYALHAKKVNYNFDEFQESTVRFLLVFIVTCVDRLN
jgi:hypothetical protein